jgi:hypothetical protein
VKEALIEPHFPNARSLEAYFVGQQYLNSYLRNIEEPVSLVNAENEFRRLQKDMPDFVDGVMLLGITLSERRAEADAVVTYERAKILLKERMDKLQGEIAQFENFANTTPDQKLRQQARTHISARKAARIAAQKTFFQAQLFQANAYRKLYNWNDLVRAVAELDDVAEKLVALQTTPLPDTSPLDQLEFSKIGATALAEKASALAYGLILLYPETFIDRLKNLKAPRTVEVPQVRREALSALAGRMANPPSDQDIIERNALFMSEMKLLASKQKAVLLDARAAVQAVKDDGSTADQATWEKEKKRIESLLLSAEAYRIFRLAQLVEPDTEQGNKNFIEKSELALRKLHEADAKQPGQYVVLQDLGIIYGDPRFDARNQNIGLARRYFERSLAIKPDDYFGHQSLVVLAVRQGLAWGVDAEEPFKSAASHAAKSLEQRPGNGTVFLAQAQLAALSWSVESDTNKKKTWQASFNATLASARNVGANPTRIMASQLQWGLQQLRSAAEDKTPAPAQPEGGTFSAEKRTFSDLLDKTDAEAAKIPGWEAQQLRHVIGDLTNKLDASTSNSRERLVWPPAPVKPQMLRPQIIAARSPVEE